MFTPDKPIEHLNDDKLGRAGFAKRLGEAITAYDENDSFVIGLYGAWGSGKTSVINMAIDAIKEQSAQPIIIKFNSWNYSDQNQLAFQFFKQLAFAVGLADHEKHYKKVIKSLNLMAKVVAPLAAVHASGIALKDIINSVKDTVKKIADSHKDNLDLIKQEINSALRKYDKKILIVIDDIDRLNNQEIRQIFQLVKSLADFENTIYLLSLDKKIVVDALSEAQTDSGNEYLEKIIQASFELPPASNDEVASFLFKRLDEILQTDEKHFDQTHWGNIYHSGIKYYFKTIRDVVRYTNVLSFSYELVRGEVNPTDFLAITAFQVFDTKIYTAIQEHRNVFLKESDKNNNLLEVICGESIIKKDAIEQLLIYLFPKANKHMGYPNEWFETWRKALRISSPELFDIYFRLSLMHEQISQAEIDTVLKAIDNAETLRDELINVHSKGKITAMLDRFMDYRNDFKLESIENIFYVLLDIGDTFINKRHGMYSDTNQTKISRLLFHLAKRLNADEYFMLLSYSIDNSSNGAYVCLSEVIDVVNSEEEAKKESYLYENFPVLDEAQKKKLLQKMNSKLIQLCESSNLSTCNELYVVFIWWLRIADEHIVRQYVDKLIASDDALVQFLCTAVSRGYSQSVNDFTARETLKFNCESMPKLLDIEAARMRVDFMLGTKELNEEQKKILEIFAKNGVGRAD